MKYFTKFGLIVAASVVTFSAGASHLRDQILLSARMNGGQEVPALLTTAVGVTGLTLNSSRDTMMLRMTVTGLSGPITGAHIHRGAPGVNGPVVFSLTPFLTGTSISTTITGTDLTTEMLAEYLEGKLYVNVHTMSNPGGEIRGQILQESDMQFIADLRGEQQNPPVMGSGYGLGTFSLSKNQGKMTMRVVANSVTGVITGAHFHRGAPGVNGPVVMDLMPYLSGTTLMATIDPSTILTDLLAGDIYINLHTAANPGGEIRGQLYQDNRIAFDALMNGDQEVPPVTTTNAMGVANFKMNTRLDTLTYDIVFNGLSGPATGANINVGGAGTNGLLLLDMTSAIAGNRITGMATGFSLSNTFVNNLLQGNFYLNIQTAANPAGEIRGQIYRLFREGYTATIKGSQEVPPVSTNAMGTAVVSVDRDQSDLHFMIVADSITPTGMHFHKGMAGEVGPVIFDLMPFFTNNGAFGYWKSTDATPFTTAQSRLFRNDSAYVNLHTPAHPGGEIRGQMERGFRITSPTGIRNMVNIGGLSLFPVPAASTLQVKMPSARASQIRIFNNVGALVLSRKVAGTADDVEVDVSTLKNGVYQLQLQTTAGNYLQRFNKE